MSITHSAPAHHHGLGTFLARLGDRLAEFCGRAEQSHRDRLGFAQVSAEVSRDIGISAEEATGLPSQQADLPFFMQAGFMQAGFDRR